MLEEKVLYNILTIVLNSHKPELYPELQRENIKVYIELIDQQQSKLDLIFVYIYKIKLEFIYF